jgi:sodium pump decarboxylase gamma subunit
MNNALLISLIGAGMVFVGLILLWIMMDILVRLTNRKKGIPEKTENTEPNVMAAEDSTDIKQQAAAIAVAAALALSASPLSMNPTIQSQALSPWQELHRTRQLNQAGRINSHEDKRKNPG